jgi:hypothetical protein
VGSGRSSRVAPFGGPRASLVLRSSRGQQLSSEQGRRAEAQPVRKGLQLRRGRLGAVDSGLTTSRGVSPPRSRERERSRSPVDGAYRGGAQPSSGPAGDEGEGKRLYVGHLNFDVSWHDPSDERHRHVGG